MIFAPRHTAESLAMFGIGRNSLMWWIGKALGFVLFSCITQGPFFGVLFHILWLPAALWSELNIHLFPSLGPVLFPRFPFLYQTGMDGSVFSALQSYSSKCKNNPYCCPPGNKMQGKEEGKGSNKLLSQLQPSSPLSRKQMDCRMLQCAELWSKHTLCRGSTTCKEQSLCFHVWLDHRWA